jgi:hypothetical protein
MPLAPAHPAAVLPLQRLGLPMSALVTGAVAPDLPVYLPVGVSYATTHSGRGLPVDVVMGMVILWLWSVLVRDAVVDLTPYLRRRLPPRARLDRRAWLLAPIAVAIGAATHVLWDSTTHDWGFVVHEVGFLSNEYGPLPLYRWLQHASTVIGSIVVAAYGVRVLSRQRPVPREPAVRRPAAWWAALGVIAVVAAIVLRDPEAAVGAMLVASLGVGGLYRWSSRSLSAG